MMSKNKKALEKLQSIVKPDPGSWKKEAQWRHENKTWIRKSQKIAFKILRTLRDQKKTQKDLAAMMNVSPQQVNKWVKGKENFTLETLSRIEEALKIDLLAVNNGDKTELGNQEHFIRTSPVVLRTQYEKEKLENIKLKSNFSDFWTVYEAENEASKIIELKPDSNYKKRIHHGYLFVAEPDVEYY
jgi:transcriptional regulator with XRE-family HTH domain